MAILNYSTSVPAVTSIGQITSILVRKAARSITTEFSDDGSIEAVSFIMSVGGIPVRFFLPSNVDGVARVMLKDQPWSPRRVGTREQYEGRIREQAFNVAWRILKDWVEAQMALVESGQAEPAQVFMPYATQQDGRTTMWQMYLASNEQKALRDDNGSL